MNDNTINAENNLTKNQKIGLILQLILVIIGFIISVNSIYVYSIQRNFVAVLPIVMLAISYISIIYYALKGYKNKKALIFYKIGICLFLITTILSLAAMINNVYLGFYLQLIQIILLIIFIIKLNDPKIAQNAINLVVVLNVINFVFVYLYVGRDPFAMLTSFSGVIIRGTYALSYKLSFNKE